MNCRSQVKFEEEHDKAICFFLCYSKFEQGPNENLLIVRTTISRLEKIYYLQSLCYNVVNRYNRFVNNFVHKLDVLFPLVTGELHQNMVDLISNLIHKLLKLKISRRSILLKLNIITDITSYYVTS